MSETICTACGKQIDGMVLGPLRQRGKSTPPDGWYHPSCLDLLELERRMRDYIDCFSPSVQEPTKKRVSLVRDALDVLSAAERTEGFRVQLVALETEVAW